MNEDEQHAIGEIDYDDSDETNSEEESAFEDAADEVDFDAEDGEPEPEEPDAEEPVSQAAPTAPYALPVSMTAAQRAFLEENIEPTVLNTLLDVLAQNVQAQVGSGYVGDSFLQAESATAPQYFAARQQQIRQDIASLPPEQRSNQKAVQAAIILREVQNAKPGTTLKGIIAKMSREMGGVSAPQAAPAKRAPSAPPAKRVPTPTTSGGRGNAPSSKSNSVRSSFIETFGLDSDIAAQLRREGVLS